MIHVWTDGCSRGNPGPGGAEVVCRGCIEALDSIPFGEGDKTMVVLHDLIEAQVHV